MTPSAEVAELVTGLDKVVARIAPRFGRSEPRRRAAAYLRGLLSVYSGDRDNTRHGFSAEAS